MPSSVMHRALPWTTRRDLATEGMTVQAARTLTSVLTRPLGTPGTGPDRLGHRDTAIGFDQHRKGIQRIGWTQLDHLITQRSQVQILSPLLRNKDRFGEIQTGP